MPVNGRFQLDTNVVIALLEGDGAVVWHLNKASEIFIPVTAIGELYFGAMKSARPAENLARVETFVKGRSVIPGDLNVSREYGRVKQLLREKGRPIPENDIWIAATAKAHGLMLVSRDRHFREVHGLSLVEW